jgi:hypothetical protein
MFIFVFLYPLHVSALIGHPQAEYTIAYTQEDIVPTADLLFCVFLSYAL